jgi:hypothetical protein
LKTPPTHCFATLACSESGGFVESRRIKEAKETKHKQEGQERVDSREQIADSKKQIADSR